MPLEEDVKQDVRKWSELFLEVPNIHLGGYPACPFAKKTWTDNRVVVEVKRTRIFVISFRSYGTWQFSYARDFI